MRTFDAAMLNRLAAHPAIRPHIGAGDVPVDLTAMVADHRNICIAQEHGAFVFLFLEPGLYELHTMIAPEGRGAAVLPAARAAFRYVFKHAGGEAIVTMVPACNRPAALMARRAGFTQINTLPGAWEDGSDVLLFRLPKEAATCH